MFALCALCRQALASGGNEGLIRGLYLSILLIAGMPLLILAGAAVLVWRARRAKPLHVVERSEPL
jgi:Na+/serine symporter